jgi:hypothetical protein
MGAEGEAGIRMRIGRVSLENGPGKVFCGSGVGGSSVDGFRESCSVLGEISRSRDSSCRRCRWSICNIARQNSSEELEPMNVTANSESSGILHTTT